MKPLNILIFLLIFNTFILLGFLVSEFTGKVTYEKVIVNVTRVIDGDTFVYKIGNISQSVRLLGINTPEKKQPYYQEAKDFLARYEGKQIELEAREKDKYQRTLAYLFYNNELINAEILRNGLANLYVYEKDAYYQELAKAEERARESGIGLWRKSVNYGCIKIMKFQPIDSEYENETLILENVCSVALDIIIKDDANHIYDERTSANSELAMHFKDIFNDDGDTLMIRDKQGLLLFYRY